MAASAGAALEQRITITDHGQKNGLLTVYIYAHCMDGNLSSAYGTNYGKTVP